MRIPQAAQLIGVGRTTLYELIACGDLETIRIGRSRLIPMVALRALIERRRASGPPS
ncbi:helix-turn-helix domain-containing protein [Sphingomonas abietis]|uniref:Helix-turn-helix domain-containing protein n=1 Tax=Sphingomonas abietis TaxID=3012344 RepID=A0ABY7NSV1_9SPHN|nr:helix-turn-helix domain-containing protein [Sphingomonas abietis]WBO24580.1 helix-turn-helix domain-containing protein [Sphingomonas abietis]